MKTPAFTCPVTKPKTHWRVSGWAFALAVAVCTLTLTPRASAASKESREAVDACTLLSVDEIKAVLGSSVIVRPGRPNSSVQDGTACRFGLPSGNLNFALARQTPQRFEEMRKFMSENGEKLENVSGLGDAAYFWNERICVQVGNQSLAIWFGNPEGANPQRREQLLSLAKAGVPKLR